MCCKTLIYLVLLNKINSGSVKASLRVWHWQYYYNSGCTRDARLCHTGLSYRSIKREGEHSETRLVTIHPATIFFTCRPNRLNKSYTRVNYTQHWRTQWCTIHSSLSQKKLQEPRINLYKIQPQLMLGHDVNYYSNSGRKYILSVSGFQHEKTLWQA